MVKRHAYAFACVGLVALLSGCPDPDVEFADFEERYNAINGQGGSGQGGGKGQENHVAVRHVGNRLCITHHIKHIGHGRIPRNQRRIGK